MHRISLKFAAPLLMTVLGPVPFSFLGAQQTAYPPTSTGFAVQQPSQTLFDVSTPIPPLLAALPVSSSADTSGPVVPEAGQQQPAPPTDEQAPQPQTNPNSAAQSRSTPDFRAANADARLPPQSVRQKFVTASQDSLEYSSTVVPAVLASLYFGLNTVPQFGGGGAAFGRYLWHATVDQTVENYMVGFVVPVVTREDTRYYVLGHGGFLNRTDYALSRAVITRSDSGKEVFNISEIAGAGASAGLTNLYYPAPQRTLSNTAINWSLDVGLDAATFVLREFWPDIDHRLFHKNQ